MLTVFVFCNHILQQKGLLTRLTLLLSGFLYIIKAYIRGLINKFVDTLYKLFLWGKKVYIIAFDIYSTIYQFDV
jgi:hypothetical protein